MQIDKDIPVPGDLRVGRPPVYPFKQMEVGDSLFLSDASTTSKEYRAAQAYGRTNGKRFVGRTIDNGLRIWRIA